MNEKVFAMNTGITWTPLELRGLLEDEDSYVNFERATRHIGLHPFHLTNVNAALREILGSSLNSYDSTLNGIIISYKNPKLLSKMGQVLYDSCYIHIDIEVDFYVFRPTVGSELKGIVNKKSEDHIGILVHKAFNVSIRRPDDDDEDWPGYKVNIGQEVRLTVTHLDYKRRLPYILGSLDAEGYLEGCKPYEPQLDEEDEAEVKPKNKKLLFGDDGEIVSSPSKVKNKRITHESYDGEDEEMKSKVSRKLQKKMKKEADKNKELAVATGNRNKLKAEVQETSNIAEASEVKTKIKRMKNDSSDETETSSTAKKRKKLKVRPNEMANEFDEVEKQTTTMDQSSDDVETSMKVKKKGKIKNENDVSPSKNVTVTPKVESDDDISKKKIKKQKVTDEVHVSEESDMSPIKKKKKKKNKEKEAFNNTTSIVNSTRFDDFKSESTTKIEPEVERMDNTIISGHLDGFVQKPKTKSLKLQPIQKIKKEKVTSSDDSSVGKLYKLNDSPAKKSKKKHSIDSALVNLSTKNEDRRISETGLEKSEITDSEERRVNVNKKEVVNEKEKEAMSNGSIENTSNHNVRFSTDNDSDDGMKHFDSPKNRKPISPRAKSTTDSIKARRKSSNSKSSVEDLEKSTVKTELPEKKKSKNRKEELYIEQDTASILEALEAAKAKYEELRKEIERRASIKSEESS